MTPVYDELFDHPNYGQINVDLKSGYLGPLSTEWENCYYRNGPQSFWRGD